MAILGAVSARMAFHPPVTLDGRWVRLVPLSLERVAELAQAGKDPEIWTYVRQGPRTTPERMAELIQHWLGEQEQGTALPFTTLLKPGLVPVGGTGFLDIRREDRGVEIGGTWLTPSLWRTPVNTESKYLLLRYAFETEGCLRVQLKTDLRNTRSQRAIERFGAKREGVLRKHLVLENGHVRDSVYYSVVDDEWPAVKARMEGLLARPWNPPRGGAGGSPA
jgi:N-acetyltransferase